MKRVDLNELSRYIKTNEVDRVLNNKEGEFYNDLSNDETLMKTRPWKQDANYFTTIKISSLAILKMGRHAIEGGNVEIMGMLVGKIHGNSIIVNDVYSLPVEGTETRVNAQSEGYEYMVSYLQQHKLIKAKENIVGWYHSHPGYGCYLSGIDIATQSLNQNFQDPYVAIVVDPIKSLKLGKVEIGAFRTYPDDYKQSDNRNKETTNQVSGSKEKFGIYANKYYSLDIEIFQLEFEMDLIKLINQETWINELINNKEIMHTEMSSKTTAINKIHQQLVSSMSSTRKYAFDNSNLSFLTYLFNCIFTNMINKTSNGQDMINAISRNISDTDLRQLSSYKPDFKRSYMVPESIEEREKEDDEEDDDDDEDDEDEDEDEDEDDEDDDDNEEEDDENNDNETTDPKPFRTNLDNSTDNLSLRPKRSRRDLSSSIAASTKTNQLLKLCNELSTNELKDLIKYDVQQKLFE